MILVCSVSRRLTNQKKHVLLRLNSVMFSPILVFDDGVDDLLHLLGEGQRVRGKFLSRRAAAFLRLLHLLVLLAPSPAAGARRGRAAVVVAVSLALPGRLLVTHLLLDVLQISLFDGLR